jgi:outer membrane protein TolC
MSLPAAGQSPFFGSVPPQPATGSPIALTLGEAIDRALKYNLGILTLEQQVEATRAGRWRALSGLLPTADGLISENRQKVNLAAFGFDASTFPGIPTLVGPFNVFDARLSVSQPVVDLAAINDLRRANHEIDSAKLESRNARELVVLIAANAYFQTIAASNRIDTVRAQVETAQALLTQATDLERAGVAPQIDVLRAQVELESQRQRLISVENDFRKQKIQLARIIGLPVSQPYDLAGEIPSAQLPTPTLEDAVKRALEGRSDYRAALARVQAAEAGRRSAVQEALPSVVVNADVAAIGPTAGDAQQTFSIVGAVRVPIFDGGRRRARVIESDATLRERRAEAEDFRQRVEAEVTSALLDLQATEAQLRVAQGVVNLARTQLTQAQDRFGAGVTNNLEVIQAQESLAAAADTQITSLYAYNVARAALARAMGIVEETAKTVLGGVR